MSFETVDAVGPVRTSHQLDEPKLKQYLRKLLPGLSQHAQSFEILQFKHGQSNPTYLLKIGPSLMVLRKKPQGKILASAHAVEREFQVISSLSSTSVPVPRVILNCEVDSVIGTPFYLMQFVDGKIYIDPNLPNTAPHIRTKLYQQAASTLATLHSVNPLTINLTTFGNPNNYCLRQLQRWSKQYHASTSSPTPDILNLIHWLKSNIPAADASPPHPSICHGDYRLDNLVFSTSHEVKAILDWELSTLGNPWADVAYSCLAYHLPATFQILPAIRQPLPSGILTEQEYLSWYCSARGVPPPSQQDWSFYLGLSLFRLAAILAGVQARSQQGNASSARAAEMGSQEVIDSLASTALGIVRASPPGPPPFSCACKKPLGAAPCGCSGCKTKAEPCSCGGGKKEKSGTTGSASTSACGSSGSCGEGCGAKKSGNVGGGASSCGHGSSCGASCGSGKSGAERPATPCSEERLQELKQHLSAFMQQHVYPAEKELIAHTMSPDRWTIPPLLEHLKSLAKQQGLWNLWMPPEMSAKLTHLPPLCPTPSDAATLLGAKLTNRQYADLCEIMGRSPWASECFNCSAPDTGNMEVLAKYGSDAQQRAWLLPLLRGQIRSCFAMTEKGVASSDATNIQSQIVREGGGYVLDGRKWWTTGANDPRCKICVFMGKTDPSGPKHGQQSMVLVPMDTEGVRVVRPMHTFGYDEAPHGHAEVEFKGVRVPLGNMILGEGRGFEIAQGRLGPGRLHHCMRVVGLAERSLEMMAKRGLERRVFGGMLAEQGGFQQVLAKCRVQLDAARLLVLAAAEKLDQAGVKGARKEIAVAKVAAPTVALRVMDAAIQAFGAEGVSQDTVLAYLYALTRTLRIADGPDEVHLRDIARMELRRVAKL